MSVSRLAGALAIASALLATSVSAQSTLSGRIVDAGSGLPVEYATASAFTLDTTLVEGSATDTAGRFSLVLPEGSYLLRLEFIGFVARDTVIELSSDTDLGPLALGSEAIRLDGATVTATRSQLSLKLDKQIYDVGADLVSQGGSANEVLENVPTVSVSPEGVVSLRGSEGVKILINGKPSALADNNALQGIAAANIEKVEVMTSPSARYEAAGSAGIINIILKDNASESWGGQVSASVGIPADYQLNANFNRSTGKWTYFGNAGLRYSNYKSTGTATRISELPSGTQVLDEDLKQDRDDRAWNAFGGFDFRPSEKTTLSASYSVYHQTNEDLSNVAYTYTDGAGELDRDWLQTYNYLEPETYHQIEATYARELARPGQKLFVLFQNDFWDNDEQELTSVFERFPANATAFEQRTRTLESSNDYLLQADYEQGLGEHGKLEFGLRGETRIISSDYLAEQKVTEAFETYRGLDNEVDYYERIGAAYAQYAYEKESWGIQLGLRNEFTEVIVEDQLPETEEIKKRYNWLFPSATVSYTASDKLSGSLGYSKRIRRPYFGQLNPFGGIENINELSFGNPDLDPSFRDFIELKVLYKTDKFTLAPFANLQYINNFFDTYVQQEDDGLVTYLNINLEQERIISGGVTATYEPVKDWQLAAEGYVAAFRQTGIYADVDFGNSFRTATTEVSVRGKLVKDIRVQATFELYGPQRYLQSFREAAYRLNGGLSRKFLSDRLQLTLNVRNAFGLQVFRGGARLPSFTNDYARVWQGQRFQLTAAWDLGQEVRLREARGSIR